MEKEMYERAEMEVVEFEVEDVITASGVTGGSTGEIPGLDD